MQQPSVSSLSNIKVLDLTQYYAGPHAAMLLADLGAEVIKVERPDGGEGQRHVPPFIQGEPYLYLMLNRNKKSITLNLADAEGKRLFKELAQKADVVVENFSPGVMEKLGLSYDILKGVNPRIIYGAVSGFGQTGPYRSRPAYDPVAQAMSGLMSVTGFPEVQPTRCGPALGDVMGSLYLVIGVLIALRHRDQTGRGQMIDIALLDVLWALTSFEYAPQYFLTGQSPTRKGNRHPNVTPFNTYPTTDGYVVIATAADHQWQSLCHAMGRDDLARNERYTTLAKRRELADEVDGLVAEWTRKHTQAEIVDALVEAHIATAPIQSIEQATRDPQLLSRRMIEEIEHPRAGKHKATGSVLKLSETPGEIRTPAPALGENNNEVYRGWLGLSAQKLAGLKKRGVV